MDPYCSLCGTTAMDSDCARGVCLDLKENARLTTENAELSKKNDRLSKGLETAITMCERGGFSVGFLKLILESSCDESSKEKP